MPLATTKIWPVRDSLRRVVDYAANPDKTEYSGLAQALHYAENDAKTTLQETAQLVSGVHCRPATAWAEMRAVQEQFGKTEGVVAMHAYQSFKPGEVTPEQCHAIGVELALRVWGGRFQVLVATHLNTGCLHNHFVINAVSYVDGKKYEQRRDQYREMRRVSDQLCREHALSVIQQPGGKKPRPLYEGEGQTRYEAMRRAIRKALAQTSTERDFARVLRQQGYLWRREEGRKYATLRSLDGGRAVRVYRLGTEYDWPALERALAKNFARYGPHFYDLNFNPKYSLRPRPLVEGFAQRLRALKEQQKYNEKLCGNCYNQKFKGYLFVDEMGNLILPNTVTDNFAQLLKEHGLRKIRFHDLRHSCASLLLKQGVPMKQIQEWLGHSDISTTANIYAHLDSQSKQLSAATMEKALALPEELPESRW